MLLLIISSCMAIYQKGVCHYMANALKELKETPQDISRRIASNTYDLSKFNDINESMNMDELMPFLKKHWHVLIL